MSTNTTSAGFFEGLYRRCPDPWQFASSPYEQQRYATVFDALGFRRYARVFEPGCSIGVLTARLAELCDSVEAMDISDTAVVYARQRCRLLTNVVVRQGAFPDSIPAGSFDLIVLSEIGYYFDVEQLTTLESIVVGRMRHDGILLAAHWLGHSDEHLLSGDQVHQVLGEWEGLEHLASEQHPSFRLDLWKRR